MTTLLAWWIHAMCCQHRPEPMCHAWCAACHAAHLHSTILCGMQLPTAIDFGFVPTKEVARIAFQVKNTGDVKVCAT
jgi:hypothetical protein